VSVGEAKGRHGGSVTRCAGGTNCNLCHSGSREAAIRNLEAPAEFSAGFRVRAFGAPRNDGAALALRAARRHICDIMDAATPATAAPAIAVDALVKRYKGATAVDGISFQLAPGSITGLLGGNGAGKTTTIATLMGLVPPPPAPSRCWAPGCRNSVIACCTA
jgi:ABC-type glutathione transport system ATPase component